MDRPAHAGLRHLALHARDLDAMKRFYTDVLGFEVEWEPDPDNVYLSSGIDNLALHRAQGPSTSLGAGERSGGALDHLGLIVRVPEDVDRWAEFLKSKGVEPAVAPKTHRDGARSFYFRDGRQHHPDHPPSADQREGLTLSAVRYICSTYSLTMRRAEKRGATVRIDSFTIDSQRCGIRSAPRS
jgi:catechol 2,3-dioxygenase-like lactoylglutathione lyase family enzyme